jgi:Pyridoxal-dependent decarboxylase, pyridoxal binding domain
MTLFSGLRPRSSMDRVVRCCSQWQRVFPDAEIVYPVRVLRTAAAADWVRGRGLGLAASCDDDLERVIAAGVAPRRVVLQCDDLPARTMWHAVGLGVGQHIVGSGEQMATLSACAERPQRVVLDITDEPDDATVEAVLDQPNLEVCGLHSRLARIDAVEEMIAVMAQLRYHRGRLLTRLSVEVAATDERPIEAIASQLADTVEGGCARFRYSRPVIQVCPDWLALTRET